MLDDICEKLYENVKTKEGNVTKYALMEHFEKLGILQDDPRLSEFKESLQACSGSLDKETFNACISKTTPLSEKVFTNSYIIKDFEGFSKHLKDIYEDVKRNQGGKLADYIPQLAKQNRSHFGVSVCTVDGQRAQIGDTCVDFCLQSCANPINYCMALEEHGIDKVHTHVGRKPHRIDPNALTLNESGLPHNPLINSGAIMVCSLIKNHYEADNRFEYVTNVWEQLSGGKTMGYSNATYLSERMCGDRNFALAYFMKQRKAFPKKINILDILEFYFQCCSLSSSTDKLSIIAGTLANGGICPLTGAKVLSPETVKNCLSMMHSCGMYDYSDEFAFKIGLPAKSGASGAIMLVIPNVMGICTFSPPLNDYGNSTRGVEFFHKLTGQFNFHIFDNIQTTGTVKQNPRKEKENDEDSKKASIIEYAASGNLTGLQRLKVKDSDFSNVNYDKRTPLHLAASNGHLNIIKYLMSFGVEKDINAIDRWMGTPYDDAIRGGYHEVAEYLQSKGGQSGIEIKMLC